MINDENNKDSKGIKHCHKILEVKKKEGKERRILIYYSVPKTLERE